MAKKQTRHSVDTEVIIVGAGLAGLYAGHKLLQAGVPFILLEAADHAGGRVFSRPERNSHLGLVLDEGASLINSTDTLALQLMDHFNIHYVRRLKPGVQSMHFLVAGEVHDQESFDALLFRESREAVNIIVNDQDAWRTDTARDLNPRYIDESIANYLARIGAGPVLRVMLKSFFWSEYGYDIRNLNLHVLFDYLEIDVASPHFKLIPNVDEAYTLPRGTGQIAENLERLCHSNIRYGHAVSSITDDGLRLTVQAAVQDGTTVTLTAHHLFFAAPFHSLKHIDVSVEGLSQEELADARRASYAAGTKLHLKFKPGFEELYSYAGILLTDTGEQIWPSSTGQGGAGLLTVLTGPLPADGGVAEAQARQIVAVLERAFPGLAALYEGMERNDAPMSYSGSLRPGEDPVQGINDGGPRWTTMGEASGGELQGYLEGALRSADRGVTHYLVRRHAAKKEEGW